MTNTLHIYKDENLKKPPITLDFMFNAKNILDSIKVDLELSSYPSIIIYNYRQSFNKKEIEVKARWSFQNEEDYNLIEDHEKKECEIIKKNNYDNDLFCTTLSGFKFISEIDSLNELIRNLLFDGLSFSSGSRNN